MNRRDLLKRGALLGSLLAPRWARGLDCNAVPPTKGPFWLFIHAAGGWDPTHFCDPKGAKNELEPNPVNHYATDDIGTVGSFSYAPVGTDQTV